MTGSHGHRPAHRPIDEHMMPLAEVCARYDVKIDESRPLQSTGLQSSKAKELLQKYGSNVMTPPKEIPLVIKYLICLSNLFNVLLVISGILCYIVYPLDPVGNAPNLYIGAILIGVAMMNALIDFVQEIKSAAMLKSFLDLVPRKTMVIRDKQLISVQASELVPGDVVFVRMGDKNPADILVFWSVDFKVDNSSLTGESDPQERHKNNTYENPLEATNIAFNGTLVMNGEAYGIVLRTGDSTMLGQIANMAGSEKKRPSPMTQEINHFVFTIATVAFFFAIIFFGIGWSRLSGIPGATVGKIFSMDLNFAIGVFISFVPEGLPATMSMLLSIAAKRMAKRNVLVKDLRGVETLGAITCLATDKTGTLTRNQMTVTLMWSGYNVYEANKHDEKESKTKNVDVPVDYSQGNMYAGMSVLPQQVVKDSFAPFSLDVSELKDILHICYLCSKAKFDRNDVPMKQRTIIGDATEVGLFTFAANTLPDSDKLAETYPKVFEIPFNSATKWHLTIHRKKHDNGLYTLLIKGAPERIFKLCSTMLTKDGKIETIGESHQQEFQKAYELMASKGHRVIGCAKFLLSESSFPEGFIFKKDEEEVKKEQTEFPDKPIGLYPKGGYTFMGLVSLEDPPKHGVREAIGQCRQAGVKVMMVTGDHPLTAEAIARKINLMLQETKEMVAKRTKRAIATIQEHEYNAIVIHGEKIDSLTEEDWERILDKEEIIFARTSPKHKLQIVKRCQDRGHIVGVTGDGVNDSPALKKADLGIAMNISGSDVSKEAAAMILLDDNFASTVAGIFEGRLIFQNLKKSIRYTISHTMPQVIANLLFLLVPLPLLLYSLQIILVDLGFELIIALAYAWELPEFGKNLMNDLPRKPVTSNSIALLRRENEYQALKNRTVNAWVSGEPVEAAIESQPTATKPDEEQDSKISILTRMKFAFARIRFWLKSWLDNESWDLFRAKREGETLVDSNLLSYSYLEIGLLETIGCTIAFLFVWWYNLGYSLAEIQAVGKNGAQPGEQQDTLQAAESAYYLGIFIQQSFNHFLCKVTVTFPVGLQVLRNQKSWFGIFGGALLSCFIVYPPFMWSPFQTHWLNPLVWLLPMAMGIVMLAYVSLRVLIARRKLPVNPNLALPLDLHPTRWSTRSK